MSKYTRLYVIALSLIAALVFIAYILMDGAIRRQSYDASVINISGQQRMLSQRMALLSAQLIYPEKREWARGELQKAVNRMEKAHKGLTAGDNNLNLPQKHSDTIHKLYFESQLQHSEEESIDELMSLNDLILHYIHEVNEVLALPDHDLVPENALLAHTVNDYHDVILPHLHEIVNQYEKESLDRVHNLKRMEQIVMLSTLSLLLFIGLFIFKPMIMQVQKSTQKLEKENQDLSSKRHQEKLASLGHLSSSLIHEINNHLQPIIGISAILKLKIKDEDIAEHINVLERNALQTRNVVRNVLSFSRVTDSSMTHVQSYALFTDIIDFAKSLSLSSIDIQIPDSFQRNLKGYTLCDTTSITQVFINLFKNASDSMDGTGAIIVNAEQKDITDEECSQHNLSSGMYTIISIKDHGIGMDEQTLSELFSPYFTTKDNGEGTGLGMSTAIKIMKQHQGSISVHSAVDLGTAVYLFFPYFETDTSISKDT